ncbi:TlpA family protein disulfide reductase [Candidatus Kaiserbacteria bacterium]|nr:TlpA family protein disulfide reductase [Candidatus Kaiserbacteria bacterium]
MRYTFILIAAVIIIAGGVYLLGGSGSQQPVSLGENSAASPENAAASGERLPALTLKDYEGNDVNLTGFSGKALIVNSWAAWCPFCRQELPDFAALQKEFPDLAVIAVDRAESLATAKRYSDELSVTGKLVLLLDPSDSFYKAIGGFTMPETIFVDKEGAIVFHKRGPMSLSEMREKVLELTLAE